jgi:hypothetical protein
MFGRPLVGKGFCKSLSFGLFGGGVEELKVVRLHDDDVGLGSLPCRRSNRRCSVALGLNIVKMR